MCHCILRMGSREIRLPDVLVIGAMKSGTTSLHHYLDLHPEIAMSKVKEVDFFTEEGNWSKGVDWYGRQLPDAARVIGESSTSYSKFPIYKGVPARIRATIPDVKLIYVLRNPIERIVSSELQWRELGLNPPDPEKAMRDFIDTSRYFQQISQYLDHFPASSLHVLFSEDLLHNRAQTLRRIFEFLGVDPAFQHPEHAVVHDSHELRLLLREREIEKAARRGESYVERVFAPDLQAAPKPTTESPIDAQQCKKIMDELAPDIAKLQQFLGLKRAPWSQT